MAMDFETDFKFEDDAFVQWKFAPGQLIQCQSDGGVRSEKKAAAACSLMVLWLANGKLERRLLKVEALFISDGSTADVAERCALTLAMRSFRDFSGRALRVNEHI